MPKSAACLASGSIASEAPPPPNASPTTIIINDAKVLVKSSFPFFERVALNSFHFSLFLKPTAHNCDDHKVFKSKSYPLVISWAVKRKRETIFLHNFFKTRRSVYSTSKSNISISFFEKKKRSDYLLNERRNLLFLSHPLFRLFRRIERSCYGRINTPHTGGRERRRMRLMRGKEEEGKKECANIRGRARERRLACRSRGMLS